MSTFSIWLEGYVATGGIVMQASLQASDVEAPSFYEACEAWALQYRGHPYGLDKGGWEWERVPAGVVWHLVDPTRPPRIDGVALFDNETDARVAHG